MKRKANVSHEHESNGVTKKRATSTANVKLNFREGLFEDKQLLLYKNEYSSSQP